MAVVAAAAVGFAALANASELWASAVSTVTVAALLAALLAAVFLRGYLRTFAGGFAICGWAYLFLIYGSILEQVGQSLATTKVITYLHPKLHVTWSEDQRDAEYVKRRFYRIGHFIWSLIVAFLGGLLARYFYATRERKSGT